MTGAIVPALGIVLTPPDIAINVAMLALFAVRSLFAAMLTAFKDPEAPDNTRVSPVIAPVVANPDAVRLPLRTRLVPVAAPMTGVTMTMLVLVQLLMLPLVTVPSVGPDKAGVLNTMPVLVQALMLPLATVPSAGVTNAGLVNSWVFVSLFVVPPCTIGIMSEDAAADAAGRLEMATVVIIKNSQRRCCSVDDWQLCRKASPSHRQGC